MTFVLGAKSRAELRGVDPRLIAVVEHAIARSPVDFAVHDGLRTLDEQRALVARGASKTMNSRHLPGPGGLGRAVDLVPYIGGKLRWDWIPLYEIAVAVRSAAIELDTPLIWGGVWDRHMADLPDTPGGMLAAVRAYCERHPGPDFIDGPHFEIARV